MNINEIETIWDEDCKIDPDNLHLESIKIPSLHSKYYQIYNNISLLKKLEENKFIELQKNKWLYYSGKADPEVYKENPFDHRVMKNDLDKYMNADSELIKSKTKIDYYQLMIKFLESIIKSIETRTFVIKNSVEFMKFTGGYS
jgi:antirestriction protein